MLSWAFTLGKFLLPTREQSGGIVQTWPIPNSRSGSDGSSCVQRDARSATRPVRLNGLASGGMPCIAGRMVISGRIGDVCAELERLNQLELAQP